MECSMKGTKTPIYTINTRKSKLKNGKSRYHISYWMFFKIQVKTKGNVRRSEKLKSWISCEVKSREAVQTFRQAATRLNEIRSFELAGVEVVVSWCCENGEIEKSMVEMETTKRDKSEGQKNQFGMCRAEAADERSWRNIISSRSGKRSFLSLSNHQSFTNYLILWATGAMRFSCSLVCGVVVFEYTSDKIVIELMREHSVCG